jgi:hypothetical protein
MKFTVQSLYTQHLESLRPSPEPPFFARSATPPVIARTPSPASSTSSSSLSTTSTHTAVPRTPRPPGSHSPARSVSSSSTVTAGTSKKANGHANGTAQTRSPPRPSMALQQSTSSSMQLTPTMETPPTFLAVIRAFIGPYLTTSRLTTALLLFVVFPLLSILLHLRRRRRLRQLATDVGGAASQSAVVSVQRKLAVAGDKKWLGRLWEEAVRAVVDTIRMGGVGFA